jgi:diguanylate cyclase (GGDEF)-like protein
MKRPYSRFCAVGEPANGTAKPCVGRPFSRRLSAQQLGRKYFLSFPQLFNITFTLPRLEPIAMVAALASGLRSPRPRIAWHPVPDDIRDELDLWRFQRVRDQVPLLYFALLCLVTTATFAVSAPVPPIIRLVIPLTILVLCAIRLHMWLRRRHEQVDVGKARDMIRTMTFLSMAMCALCSLWGVMSWVLALPEDRSYFPLFMAMGSLSVAYCLSPVPSAAIGNLSVGLAPITLCMLWSGQQMDLAAGTSIVTATLFLLRLIIQQNNQLIDILLLQRQMRLQAITDPLTGIANRRALYEQLAQAIENSAAGRATAVALIDLDGFKPVNDDYGHATGDALLRQVAERMVESCGHDAMIARLGGDEFALLVPGTSSLPIQRHVEAILTTLARPFSVGTRQINIAASVGMAEWPDGGTTADELIASADRALYRAKGMRQPPRTSESAGAITLRAG